MPNFTEFLASFDSDAHRRGKQFEHFVKWFLKHDPEWSTQVDEVWLWDEFPQKWGRDLGVDLVFRHKNGQLWAVQAKCYASDYEVTKADIDKFLSETSRKEIAHRLLVTTTDRMGANARQVCIAQEKPVVRIMRTQLEGASLEYPAHFSELFQAKRREPVPPKLHQIEAIENVMKGFESADRGQLIMACGTGKTLTALWINEQLQAERTLVLVPSLSLLSQFLFEWSAQTREPFEVLCVCSDETVGKRQIDEAITTVADLSFPVTNEVSEIAKFLSGDGRRVVFSTYQSSPLIAEAQSQQRVPDFDFAFADEAHRCAGKVAGAFATILDGTKIRAKKRLFATATPRTYSTSIKKGADELGVSDVSAYRTDLRV